MREIGVGLWRWSAPHPRWHAGEFGSEVASYALRQGRDTVMIDPIVPQLRTEAFLGKLDAIVRGKLTITLTLGYHARDSARLADRYASSRHVEILGPKAAASRMPPGAPFRVISPGEKLPHRIAPQRIGSPRRGELPLLLPKANALAFGDTIVEHLGELRLWEQSELTKKRRRWNSERLIPSLEPLLELDFERVLVTHGKPVMRGGCEALAAALAAGPWYHPG